MPRRGPPWGADPRTSPSRWPLRRRACSPPAGAGGRPARAAAAWLVGTAELAWARIAPGPRDRDEVARMLATSAAIPAAASWHWLAGTVRHRNARPLDSIRPLSALLLDRDGTLEHDVAYNADPALVRPVRDAAATLARVRRAGLPLAVVSNQSGVARGLISESQLAAVQARVDELLGPFDDWQVCRHDGAAGCACRKPAPGMVLAAAATLGVPPHRVLMVGDIEADVAAARAAGALGVLVPTPATRPDEVARAQHVRPTLASAVDFLLDPGRA